MTEGEKVWLAELIEAETTMDLRKQLRDATAVVSANPSWMEISTMITPNMTRIVSVTVPYIYIYIYTYKKGSLSNTFRIRSR